MKTVGCVIMENFNPKDVIQLLIFMIISIFGMFAKMINNGTELIWSKIITHVALISFCSMMVYFVFSLINLPDQVGYIMAGLTGWLGPKAMEYFIKTRTDIDIKGIEEEQGEWKKNSPPVKQSNKEV